MGEGADKGFPRPDSDRFLDHPQQGWLILGLDPGLGNGLYKGQGRAIQNRQLRPLHLDAAVVNAQDVKGGQQVFHRLHLNRGGSLLQQGAEMGRGQGSQPSRDLRGSRLIHPHKHPTAAGRSWMQTAANWQAGVQANAF
jgi:hypothetical protein